MDMAAGPIGSSAAARPVLWQFRERYKSFMAHELTVQFPDFAAALVMALDAMMVQQEAQSERVLMVLREKDELVDELEREARVLRQQIQTQSRGSAHASRHVGTQVSVTSKPSEVSKVTAQLQQRIEEQEEQIDVLLDELHRLRKEHEACSGSAGGGRDDGGREMLQDGSTQTTMDMPSKTETAVQTPVTSLCDVGTMTDDTPRAKIAMLQQQMHDLVARNDELQAQIAEAVDVSSCEEVQESPIRQYEKLLQHAFELMQNSMSCVQSEWDLWSMDADLHADACISASHELQAKDLQVAHLNDIVHDLRQRSMSLLDTPSSLLLESLPQEDSGISAKATLEGATVSGMEVCPETIRRAFRFVRHQQVGVNGWHQCARQMAKLIAQDEPDQAWQKIVSGVREWAQWEAIHLSEVQALRRKQNTLVRSFHHRIDCLRGAVIHLKQDLSDYKSENEALRRIIQAPVAQQTRCDEQTCVERDLDAKVLLARVHELEQVVLEKDEQLQIAHRVVDIASMTSDTAAGVDRRNEAIQRIMANLKSIQEQKVQDAWLAQESIAREAEFIALKQDVNMLSCNLEDVTRQKQVMERENEASAKEKSELKARIDHLEAVRIADGHVVSSTSVVRDPAAYYLARLSISERNREYLLEELQRLRRHARFVEQSVCDSQVPGRQDRVSAVLQQLQEAHRSSIDVLASIRGAQSADTRWNLLIAQNRSLWKICCTLGHHIQKISPAPASGSRYDFEMALKLETLIQKVYELEKSRVDLHAQGTGADSDGMVSTSSHNDGGVGANSSTTHDALPSRGLQRSTVSNESQGTRSGEEAPLRATDIIGTQQSDRSHPLRRSRMEEKAVEVNEHVPALMTPRSADGASKQSTEHARLRRRQQQLEQTNARLVKSLEQVLARADFEAANNSKLSKKLARCEKKLADLEQHIKVGQIHTEAREDQRDGHSQTNLLERNERVEELEKALANRESENLQLVQTLCEANERCRAANESVESLTRELKECRSQHQNSDVNDQIRAIQQQLQQAEQEKDALIKTNTEQLKQIQELKSFKEKVDERRKATASQSTDTSDLGEGRELIVQLRGRLEEVEMLLEKERSRYERLQTSMQRKHTRLVEDERDALVSLREEKAKYQLMVNELRQRHINIRHEFHEYQAASVEAHSESEKRIKFLMKCLQECCKKLDGHVQKKDMSVREFYDGLIRAAKAIGRARSTDLRIHSTTIKDSGGDDTSQLNDLWQIRCAKLENEVHLAQVKQGTFHEMLERLENQVAVMGDELRSRTENEVTLEEKCAALRTDLANLRAHCSSLASRNSELEKEVHELDERATKNTAEVSRVKGAMQRKSDLMEMQRKKYNEVAQELDTALVKIAELMRVEKAYEAFQQKMRDQSVHYETLKRDVSMYHEDLAELTSKLDKERNQNAFLAARITSLKCDNTNLRTRLKDEVKKQSDHVLTDIENRRGEANQTLVSLKAEVQSLKQRVMKKQQLLLDCQQKLQETLQELEAQRTKATALAQANKEVVHSKRIAQELASKQVASLYDEWQGHTRKVQHQLDGLRASVFDVIETFVTCSDNDDADLHGRSRSSSFTTASMYSGPEHDESGEDELVEMQKWTELSSNDLKTLRISSSTGARLKQHAHDTAMRRRLLHELEQALEANPEDCRAELSHSLTYLQQVSQRMPAASVGG